MTAPSPRAIASELADRDPSLARLIEIVGPPPARRPIPVADRFERLAVAILHQQLAGAAAATITRRTHEALGGRIGPDEIRRAPEGLLRSCGISGAKERALNDLADRVHSGALPLTALGRKSDDEVIAELSAVRGIGRWTAEMFLMGPLGRHDVWPVGDLGVRNGWGLLQGLSFTPEARDLEGHGAPFRPYRSSVAWYCWQAVDVARSNGGLLPWNAA